ncbi:elongation factor G [Streptomyces olivaceus]|uniref:elongation factor G n=1 Tax=Streptomyces olivaceus TaxID=47716 RepID=UPI001884BDB1|nr:TetM/TetW/TetO/TetS family tetracycline resistance ribosomal protection protein [Streptomyces olivaceus]
MSVVNLGIVAHIDAGKTTLTERLLFDSGTIQTLGSVDSGSTQTDSDEIERRRGITIRTAVTSFRSGSLQVNLVDTPGHSEFIAEVERALKVLDGAVLVLSAVEGVQAQTRLLMRTLRAMRLPTLLFVNKIDRSGAREGEVLKEIREQLGICAVPLNRVEGLGASGARALGHGDDLLPVAESLAEYDEELLDHLVAGKVPDRRDTLARLRNLTAEGEVYPLVFGSARTGQGVDQLRFGMSQLFPPASGDAHSGVQGLIFAIERAASGEKTAQVRLFQGTLRPRERVICHRRASDGSLVSYTGQLTSLKVLGGDTPDVLTAGHIARVSGLSAARVGDGVGMPESLTEEQYFARPILETLVRPRHPEDRVRLHAALANLAEQDPMIDTRATSEGATSVLLYGEIQKEIIAETLLRDYGLEAVFESSRALYLERPVGSGAAVLEMGSSPFLATVGLRLERASRDSGVTFARETEYGALPRAFDQAIQDTIRSTLAQGLFGWPVTDCRVTLVRSGFDNACSTAGDFRLLTPVVLMRALAEAGSRVFEPCHQFEVEMPLDALSVVTTKLASQEAKIRETLMRSGSWLVSGSIPARRVHAFTRRLPELTGGTGLWWSRPHGDRQVKGPAPSRSRSDGNPLNPQEYFHSIARRTR